MVVFQSPWFNDKKNAFFKISISVKEDLNFETKSNAFLKLPFFSAIIQDRYIPDSEGNDSEISFFNNFLSFDDKGLKIKKIKINTQ